MKPFLIVDAITQQIMLHPDSGEELRFSTKNEATSLISYLRGEGKKPKLAVDDDDTFSQIKWREREKEKVLSGTIRQVPFIKHDWFKNSSYSRIHFPFYSNKFPGKISYTATEADGILDKQTTITFEKYLDRFFASEDFMICDGKGNGYDYVKKEFIRGMPDIEIFFAKTKDEIRHVYETGPSSCLAGSAKDLGLERHPAEIYASGDFEIAYIKNKDGKVSGRVVTVPSEKLFSPKGYGNYIAIEGALESKGYRSFSKIPHSQLMDMLSGKKVLVFPAIADSEWDDEENFCRNIAGLTDYTISCPPEFKVVNTINISHFDSHLGNLRVDIRTLKKNGDDYVAEIKPSTADLDIHSGPIYDNRNNIKKKRNYTKKSKSIFNNSCRSALSSGRVDITPERYVRYIEDVVSETLAEAPTMAHDAIVDQLTRSRIHEFVDRDRNNYGADSIGNELQRIRHRRETEPNEDSQLIQSYFEGAYQAEAARLPWQLTRMVLNHQEPEED